MHEDDSNAVDALGQQPLKCHSELVTIQPLPYVQLWRERRGGRKLGEGGGKEGGREGGKEGGREGGREERREGRKIVQVDKHSL